MGPAAGAGQDRAGGLGDLRFPAGGRLPAEDGRRRRPPAEPALRKRREGCNDRTIGRIDCPVVPERPPSGQLVSGSGQAGVGGHAGVRGGPHARTDVQRLRPPPAHRSPAWPPGWALPQPRGHDNSCSAWPDTGREPPRPGPATHPVPRASGQGLRCGPRAPSDLPSVVLTPLDHQRWPPWSTHPSRTPRTAS